MKELRSHLINCLINFFKENYETKITQKEINISITRDEFEGDLTLIVFPLVKFSKDDLFITSNKIGNYILSKVPYIVNYNIIKGFLNVVISDKYLVQSFLSIISIEEYSFVKINNKTQPVVIEFCSPNTNKPLHLGHIRNNLLGFSISNILKATGNKVERVQIINDRGIHICKSMAAWILYSNGETPKSSFTKGDHFVGKYYVLFEKTYNQEVKKLILSGKSENDARNSAPIMLKAKDILIKWEKKDPNIISLWKKMNNWVYQGFNQTHNRLGISFDKNYYESDTYLHGKKYINEGINKNIFYKKNDGSVWVNLKKEGLDEKILLRSDGTSVYITQDIGTAILRKIDFNFEKMIYVVGNEQDYHFKVLFMILKKLKMSWSSKCYHLSYGMVDLPNGKMKSREGTTVDADNLMDDMVLNSKELSKKIKDDIDVRDENQNKYEIIGLAALKYFILKVDPKKRILFNPNESIDFNGNTGPFIQYTYVRILALKRKNFKITNINDNYKLIKKEKKLIKLIFEYPNILIDASENLNPSILANYLYKLVKEYNHFYQNVSIFKSKLSDQISFRLILSIKVSDVIKSGMKILGINLPEKM
tara:strand:- start:1591 stop:3369 length:1779 start_codon:yes stop_codon:yes gene_type:complete